MVEVGQKGFQEMKKLSEAQLSVWNLLPEGFRSTYQKYWNAVHKAKKASPPSSGISKVRLVGISGFLKGMSETAENALKCVYGLDKPVYGYILHKSHKWESAEHVVDAFMKMLELANLESKDSAVLGELADALSGWAVIVQRAAVRPSQSAHSQSKEDRESGAALREAGMATDTLVKLAELKKSGASVEAIAEFIANNI